MDQELDAMGMLDLMVRPGFFVKENRIIKCNLAAQSLMLRPDMEITELLATGREEYAEFTGGCLYLTLSVFGSVWGTSITRKGGFDVFILEQEADQSELRSMALAAKELRAPLSSVMTTADRLFPMTALEDDPDLREQVARLNRGLYQMLRVIGNMSDAGQFTAASSAMETTEISAFLEDIFARTGELAVHTGLSLRFRNLPQPLYCLADREKLERAVLNILSNAMKFTPAGGTIEAKLVRRGNRLILTVEDSGEGIGDQIRGSIHSRYLRSPGMEDPRFGIGLGMVLIRSAAAIHGGTVLIDHPEGTGTRITMTMTIRQDTSGKVRSPRLRIDYAGERDHALLELADILPASLYENL